MNQISPLPPLINHAEWLIGKWKSTAAITDKATRYCDSFEFAFYGQPMLKYTQYSSHPDTNKPMHLEQGFLRFHPQIQGHVEMPLAHNFGLVELLVGNLDSHSLILNAKNPIRISFGKEPYVLETERKYLWNPENNTLTYEFYMKTTANNKLEKHLDATFQKLEILEP